MNLVTKLKNSGLRGAELTMLIGTLMIGPGLFGTHYYEDLQKRIPEKEFNEKHSEYAALSNLAAAAGLLIFVGGVLACRARNISECIKRDY